MIMMLFYKCKPCIVIYNHMKIEKVPFFMTAVMIMTIMMILWFTRLVMIKQDNDYDYDYEPV